MKQSYLALMRSPTSDHSERQTHSHVKSAQPQHAHQTVPSSNHPKLFSTSNSTAGGDLWATERPYLHLPSPAEIHGRRSPTPQSLRPPSEKDGLATPVNTSPRSTRRLQFEPTLTPLSAWRDSGILDRRRTVGRGLPPRAIHWDRRAAPQAKHSSPRPPTRLRRMLLDELNRRGDNCRLARYRGHNLTEEGPMGPTLRSSAAPDRSTPWDSDPRADLSLSHNAVGKFACNDEFAIVTGSFCREPPPLRLALLRW